ncbi:MAG: hypothetical protein P8J02_00245, partial [Yoonia sp.]|nr:hypothetical protein [Yoonia sp.]
KRGLGHILDVNLPRKKWSFAPVTQMSGFERGYFEGYSSKRSLGQQLILEECRMDELDVDALRILKAVAEEYGKVLTLDAVDEVDVWSIDELVRYGLISVRQLHNADELTLTNEGEWYLENLLGE